MDKITYNKETKTFTYQSIVKNCYGTLKQAIIHVLKLKYKLFYDLNRNEHIAAIKGFIKIINRKLDRDPKCKYRHIVEVYRAYTLHDDASKTMKEFKKILHDDYGYDGSVSKSDYDYAVNTIINLLWYTEEEIIQILNEEFPN